MSAPATAQGRDGKRPPRRAVVFAQRALLLGALWWLLAGGEPGAWLFGGPLVLLVAYGSLRLLPGRIAMPPPAALLRFVATFLRLSFVGGLDVARRALAPRMPLDPALIEYPLHLPPGGGRTFLAAVISLLPGTLCARIEDETLLIHTLDRGLPVVAQTALLEARIAALSGRALAAETEDAP